MNVSQPYAAKDLVKVFEGWAELVPALAVRHGWTLRNPSYTMSVDAVGSWSVELWGPVDVDINKVWISGALRPGQLLAVVTKSIVTLESSSSDEIGAMILDWVAGAGLNRIAD